MDDKELVNLVIQKDPASEDIFIERYEGAVCSALHRMFGAVEEDTKQEAWLAVFKNLPKFKDWKGDLTLFVWCHSYWGVGTRRATERKSIQAKESFSRPIDLDKDWTEDDYRGMLEWKDQDFTDRVPGVLDFDKMLMTTKESTRDRAIYLLSHIHGVPTQHIAQHYRMSPDTVRKIVGNVPRRKRDTMSVTNGRINKTIPIDSPIPEGHWKGQTQNRQNIKKDSVTGKFLKSGVS